MLQVAIFVHIPYLLLTGVLIIPEVMHWASLVAAVVVCIMVHSVLFISFGVKVPKELGGD